MKKIFKLSIFLLLLSMSAAYAQTDCTEMYGTGSQVMTLATGSPGELGLVKALADAFNAQNNTAVCWKKAGSGDGLALLKDKKVDLIMVHAPEAEKKAVAEGWAIKRTLIGSNEFYIVGPAEDPAGISKATSAADAYTRIAGAKSLFLSRGDNSGTNMKELAVWKKAGITPEGSWYVISKGFMMDTLKRADSEKGYFMTDSSTWIAAKKEMKNLKILYRGDQMLVNTYNALCRPALDGPSQPVAAKFIDFVASEKGQNVIRAFGTNLYGEPIYNDAAYAKKYDR
ncbi:MAG: substrate-binding domain-containing protein [Syntrophaceae bacterium]|nr:substrate-binding domain-containing protein [Deltaproteobacteria bacterium]